MRDLARLDAAADDLLVRVESEARFRKTLAAFMADLKQGVSPGTYAEAAEYVQATYGALPSVDDGEGDQ